MKFAASKSKVERAEKHTFDIVTMVHAYTRSDDFHTVSIEYDERQRTNHLRIDLLTSRFPGDAIALTIGDALHNFRSALDLLWYEVVLKCNGIPTKWTRFPVRDTRQELIAVLNGALEQKQISRTISNFVLDDVKPYMTGNPLIWSLDDLNIRDKHQLLIPVLQFMALVDLCLEDDKGAPIYAGRAWFMDESGSLRLNDADYSRVTVKNKGHVTAAIVFDLGVPFQSEPVIKTLMGIAEEVSHTIQAFEMLLT